MPPRPASRPPPTVDTFLAALDHPLKAEIEAVRRILLSAAPGVSDAVKWNAPSFATTEFFCTMHLRTRDSVQLVFHTGVKGRDAALPPIQLGELDGFVRWLGRDRCMVTLEPGEGIERERARLEALVREWVRWL